MFTQKSSRKSASIEVAVTMDAANVTKDIQKIKARKALVHDQRNDQGADVDVTVKSSHKTTSLYFGEALKKKGKGAAVKELKKDDVRTKIKTAVRADVEEFETSRATGTSHQRTCACVALEAHLKRASHQTHPTSKNILSVRAAAATVRCALELSKGEVRRGRKGSGQGHLRLGVLQQGGHGVIVPVQASLHGRVI